MAVDTEEGWSALFLFAISPGQIIRYFERQQKAGKMPSSTLLVSDAVAPSGLRVLIGEASSSNWMETSGQTISNVFLSSPVDSLVAAQPGFSGCTFWLRYLEQQHGDRAR